MGTCGGCGRSAVRRRYGGALFDPALAGTDEHDPELDLPDPYYDGSFEDVMAMLLAATPGIVAYVRTRL